MRLALKYVSCFTKWAIIECPGGRWGWGGGRELGTSLSTVESVARGRKGGPVGRGHPCAPEWMERSWLCACVDGAQLALHLGMSPNQLLRPL